MTVKLYPEDLPAVARILIDLADDINHVATDTDDGLGLRIPDYLNMRYQMYLDLAATPDAGNVADPVPAKRGRLRKTPLEES